MKMVAKVQKSAVFFPPLAGQSSTHSMAGEQAHRAHKSVQNVFFKQCMVAQRITSGQSGSPLPVAGRGPNCDARKKAYKKHL